MATSLDRLPPMKCGFVVPAGGGKYLDMNAPGHFAALGSRRRWPATFASSFVLGVPLLLFCEWMRIGRGEDEKRRATPRFKKFAMAIDQAEAKSVADYTSMIRKAAKGGKASAAAWWLSKRVPKLFPPASSRSGVTVSLEGLGNTLKTAG
jgi:hypothetical protein